MVWGHEKSKENIGSCNMRCYILTIKECRIMVVVIVGYVFIKFNYLPHCSGIL